ncbi:MAG: metal ABC transporter permease, partial [Planctomycetota bacterium]
MIELLSDYTVRVVIFGSVMIGAVSGALGCYAYLRRQSLIGDVVAHSSLLGIVLSFLGAYLITGDGNKSLWVLIPGAIFAGLGALTLTRMITSNTRIKTDAGLGVMLAIFFGTGMMLLR